MRDERKPVRRNIMVKGILYMVTFHSRDNHPFWVYVLRECLPECSCCCCCCCYGGVGCERKRGPQTPQKCATRQFSYSYTYLCRIFYSVGGQKRKDQYGRDSPTQLEIVCIFFFLDTLFNLTPLIPSAIPSACRISHRNTSPFPLHPLATLPHFSLHHHRTATSNLPADFCLISTPLHSPSFWRLLIIPIIPLDSLSFRFFFLLSTAAPAPRLPVYWLPLPTLPFLLGI